MIVQEQIIIPRLQNILLELTIILFLTCLLAQPSHSQRSKNADIMHPLVPEIWHQRALEPPYTSPHDSSIHHQLSINQLPSKPTTVFPLPRESPAQHDARPADHFLWPLGLLRTLCCTRKTPTVAEQQQHSRRTIPSCADPILTLPHMLIAIEI